MNLNRFFEDLEAAAAFEEPTSPSISSRLSSVRSASIMVAGETIALGEVAFSKRFLVGVNNRAIVLIAYRAIERLEVGSRLAAARKASRGEFKLGEWLKSTAVGMFARAAISASGAVFAGIVLDCDKKWLLLQDNGGDSIFVPFGAISVLELTPVNKSEPLFKA